MRQGAKDVEIDFNKLYFENNALIKKLVISEFPALTLAGRQKDLSAVIDKVWSNDKHPDFYQEIFDTYNDNLQRAIANPDPEVEKMLKNNVTRLAAAKAGYITQQIERCKADSDGVVFSREEYEKRAQAVINVANSAQAAEYNTAVHRNRIVKQFDQFEKEKKLFPNIEWLHTRSATPREIHLAYVGRIWPMDDPFWKENHPGCVWNCKCDWKNTDEPATDNSGVTPVKASPGLEGNPYYTKEVFSNKHPYFSRIDKHIPDKGVLQNPDDIVYLNKATEKGKVFKEHYLCEFEPETIENRKIVNALLKEDAAKDIKLLPQIHASEAELRIRYYGKQYAETHPTKCPDCMADGNLLEFKKTSLKNFSINILKASKQGDIAVIKLSSKPDLEWLQRFCEKQFTLGDRQDLKKIIVMAEDSVYTYTK